MATKKKGVVKPKYSLVELNTLADEINAAEIFEDEIDLQDCSLKEAVDTIKDAIVNDDGNCDIYDTDDLSPESFKVLDAIDCSAQVEDSVEEIIEEIDDSDEEEKPTPPKKKAPTKKKAVAKKKAAPKKKAPTKKKVAPKKKAPVAKKKTTVAKKKAPVAKKKAAPKKKDTSKKTSRPGIGTFVIEHLKDGAFDGMTNIEIAEVVRQTFDSKTNAANIGWYKYKIKKGEL